MTKEKKLISLLIKENIEQQKNMEAWLEKRFQQQRLVMRQTLQDLRLVRLEIAELENRKKRY